ncbi:hypothetical protein PR048_018197, partial [Dryococelus australis]
MKVPMEITTTASKPFEKTALDIVGPLTVTDENNICILTFQDELTKFVFAIPLPNQEAETVAKAFVIEIILRYGTPQTLLSDQGTNFMSQLFKDRNWDSFILLHVIVITPRNIQPQVIHLLNYYTVLNLHYHFINTNTQCPKRCRENLKALPGVGNTVNIKIHISNYNVSLLNENVPLRDISDETFHSEDQATHSN